MKKTILITALIIASVINLNAQKFDNFFENKSLRMDVYHCGNHESAEYVLHKFIVEKYWAGSKVNLIDEFNYGTNMLKVFDFETNELIYSHGYCTLFQEWQTTDEAKEMNRCYEESVSMPLPKSKAIVEIFVRNNRGEFEKSFSTLFVPDDMFVTTEQKYTFQVYDAMINGDPASKVDVLILPDGYTESEMDKFKQDCDAFVEVLKTFEPFKSHINDFNVRGVLAPSKENGVDVPRKHDWKNTILDCHFDTFRSDRYCTSPSYFAIKDVAANAPYDQIYILVNSTIYGGGGIYNYYSVSTSGNMASAKVIIHEFGHAFAGLADEYFDSEVSYSDYYPFDVEPWEYNITTLVDFDSKWKHQLDKKTPIPTPVEKKYIDKLGVFEGAGYSAKGIYRPSYDCLMHTFRGDVFCGACQDAIVRMIESYR
ncbi:IgA Peptidase M64 [Odoribacter sp. OttesenSCG-928-L07]|nr:IgA Peptidase M64 [Odoribacter sp. OttesenSCG-928-L07]MDL2238911.1 IgA Peptidase M64 [Bacteroidales bacterium OttesenSCG-928-L14]